MGASLPHIMLQNRAVMAAAISIGPPLSFTEVACSGGRSYVAVKIGEEIRSMSWDSVGSSLDELVANIVRRRLLESWKEQQ